MLETLGVAVGSNDRRVKEDVSRFKEMIERRGTESGTWRGTVERTRDAS